MTEIRPRHAELLREMEQMDADGLQLCQACTEALDAWRARYYALYTEQHQLLEEELGPDLSLTLPIDDIHPPQWRRSGDRHTA